MAVRSARQESELIIRIGERALALSRSYGIEYTSAQTDLLVCHRHGNPLNLQGLLMPMTTISRTTYSESGGTSIAAPGN